MWGGTDRSECSGSKAARSMNVYRGKTEMKDRTRMGGGGGVSESEKDI